MSDDNTEAAAKLRKLGERVRAGWAKLHPVSDKHLAAVRAAVAKQWEQEQEHAGKPMAKPQRSASQSRASREQSTRQSRSKKTQSRSQSHNHGHSH